MDNIRKKAVRGTPYALLVAGVERFLPAVVLLLYAPIIGVKETGVAALSMAVIYPAMIMFKGVADVAIQRGDKGSVELGGYFVITLGLAIMSITLIQGISGPIARFYGTPDLEGLLRIHTIAILAAAAGTLHDIEFSREFDYHKQAWRKTLGGLAGLAIGFWLALQLRSAIAVVAYHVISTVAGTIVAWSGRHIDFQLRTSRAFLQKIWKPTSTQVLNQFIGQLNIRSTDILIGSLISIYAVGTFRTGMQLYTLVVAIFVTPIAQVVFSYLSALKNDSEKSSENKNQNYKWINGSVLIFFVASPMLILMSISSPTIVDILLGDEWHLAGEISRILSLTGFSAVFLLMVTSWISSQGHFSTLLSLSFIQLFTLAAAVALAAPYGVIAVSMAIVVRGFLISGMLASVMKAKYSVSCTPIAKQLGVSILISGIAAALALASSYPIENPIAKLIVESVVLVCVYVGLSVAFNRAVAKRLGSLFAALKNR